MDGFYFGSCCQLSDSTPTLTGVTSPTSQHVSSTEKVTISSSVVSDSFVQESTPPTQSSTDDESVVTTFSTASTSTTEVTTNQDTTIQTTDSVSEVASTNSQTNDVSPSEDPIPSSSIESFSSTTDLLLPNNENTTIEKDSMESSTTSAESNDQTTDESMSFTSTSLEDHTSTQTPEGTSAAVSTGNTINADISTSTESLPSSSTTSTTTKSSTSEMHSSTQQQVSESTADITTTPRPSTTTESSLDIVHSSETTPNKNSSSNEADESNSSSTPVPSLSTDSTLSSGITLSSGTTPAADASTTEPNEVPTELFTESVEVNSSDKYETTISGVLIEVTGVSVSSSNLSNSAHISTSHQTTGDGADHTSTLALETTKPDSTTIAIVNLPESTTDSQTEQFDKPMSTSTTIADTTETTITSNPTDSTPSTAVSQTETSMADITSELSSTSNSPANIISMSNSTSSSSASSSTTVHVETTTDTPISTPSELSSSSTSRPPSSQTTTEDPNEGWVPITPPPNSEVLVEINETSLVPEAITVMSQVTESSSVTSQQSSPTVENTSTATPTTESSKTTTEPAIIVDQDPNTGCGRRYYPQKKIVGGNAADFGEWPWQVSLRQWRQLTYLHKCGAALMNHNWAITAAHCVAQVQPENLLLRIGEHELENVEEPHDYVERRVELIAVHPDFDARTFEYDLALLRFAEPVEFAPNIVPICLPEGNNDYLGRTAWVTGWGRLYENGPLPSTMQEVGVPVTTNAACEAMYRRAGFVEHIPNIFLCAGWPEGGRDSCEGDSGGPLVLQRPDSEQHELIGVISWGIGCAQRNQPGVYTRITHFKQWIQQILQF